MEPIVVNGFRIDWSKAEARSADSINTIDAKQLALLQALHQAQGNIVSQQTLLDQVWPNSVVAPNTVQQTIAQLRKTLGDDGKSQKAVKTHPKLGYSLKYSPANSGENNEPSNKRLLPKTILAIAIFSFVLIATLFLYTLLTPKPQSLSISDYLPITVQGEVVQSVTTHIANNQMYYIVDSDQGQLLYQRKIGGTKGQIIAQKFSTFGSIDISPDGAKLAFAELNSSVNSKCITLISFTLSSSEKKRLLPCSSTFNHSPAWLTNSTLLYLATDKERNNKLMALDLEMNKATVLLPKVRHIKGFDVVNNTLVTLSDQEVNVYHLSGTLAALKTEHSFASQKLNEASGIRWLSAKSYALLGPEVLIMDIVNNTTKKLNVGMFGTKQVIDLKRLSGNKYLTVLSSENWDISEKQLFNDSVDFHKNNTLLAESNAKYKGNTQHVSFISNRSNSSQVWLTQGDQLTQLTHSQYAVKDYIWLNEGNALLFISGDKLWLQADNSAAIALNFNMVPTRLYQAKDNQLLLSAETNGKQHLVKFNYQNNQTKILLDKEVNWAQFIADNWFITNDSAGKLIEYKGSESEYITPLQEITVQWKYFWREHKDEHYALYFQDKKNNVWRYEPNLKKKTIVGHYNDRTLFVSDISALHSTLLSSHFNGAQKELIQVRFSTIH